ncbi:hypothetical protein BH11PSE7_BH11PSE7_29270 [soil metagenome]
MNRTLRLASLAIASAAVLALTACGGGSDSPAPAPAPAATTTAVPVTVVDGAITNATVCLDKNLNGLCDAGEPSGKTDAAGNVSLQVANADVGKYPILAVIGTDAVDVDHGPITVPYTMQAPADKSSVVSPLTTLVQTVIAATGASSADAETSVKNQTGLTVSLFQDYTKSSTAESQTAGTVARMVVVVTQQQNAAISSTAGTTAIDNTVITKADLDDAVQRKLLELLPALLLALNDPAVTAASTPAAKEAALLSAATTIVTSSGLTTASVATVVAVNNQTAATGTGTPEAATQGASLSGLNFTSANQWFMRSFGSTVAQNTADAAGTTRYTERRFRKAGSGAIVQAWNSGSDPQRQADLHFNGTAWVTCGFNADGTQSLRDAGGNNNYDYCDKLELGRASRASFDVAGRTMASVYDQIRTASYTNLTINGSPTAVLGTATFPANSKLFLQSNVALTTAPAYYPGGSNLVFVSNAAVSAGRTTSTDNVAACAAIQSSTPQSSYTSAPATLEGMIAGGGGTPCVSGTGNVVVSTGSGTASVSSGPRNEWWGQTSLSVGTLGTATTGGTQSTYYTTNTFLRVSFSAGNVAKYYACKQRSTDGSPRNCDSLGTGTYTISTVGDARTLSFGSQPSLFTSLNYERVFVQRGGKVYFGYKNRTVASPSARLNLTALNALATQLGIPTLDVNATLALSQSSYAGDWRASDNTDDSYQNIKVQNDGQIVCSYFANDGTSAPDTCTGSITPATGATTLTFSDGTFNGTFNFLTGAVTGTFSPTGGGSVTVSGARK